MKKVRIFYKLIGFEYNEHQQTTKKFIAAYPTLEEAKKRMNDINTYKGGLIDAYCPEWYELQIWRVEERLITHK